MFINLDTNCQVLVIYKYYTFITLIFSKSLKQRLMGPIGTYMSYNYEKAENTHLNNNLLGIWRY